MQRKRLTILLLLLMNFHFDLAVAQVGIKTGGKRVESNDAQDRCYRNCRADRTGVAFCRKACGLNWKAGDPPPRPQIMR